VIYLQGEALEQKRVVIREGLFFEKKESQWTLANFNEPGKRYLFAIDLKGDLYVAEEGIGISHSSFTCGKPVLGGGLLQIVQGQIKSVALESGHYMPNVEIGYQILKIFEEKGAALPNPLEVIFFHDRNKYKKEFDASPLPSLEGFRELLQSAYKGCHV
jgi:DNA-binding XRE family transcriptional regulator